MKITLTLTEAEEFAAFAIELANTYDPMRKPVDTLADAIAAATFLEQYLRSGEDGPKIAAMLIPYRDQLRRAMISTASGIDVDKPDLDQIIEALSVDWSIGDSPLRLNPKASLSAVDRLKAISALGFLALFENGKDRLRICDSVPCEEVFYDQSKAGRQRFCSKRCGTRFNVAQHRARARNMQ